MTDGRGANAEVFRRSLETQTLCDSMERTQRAQRGQPVFIQDELFSSIPEIYDFDRGIL